MKKRTGFTLVELLTVIAILAIVLLIATPTILGTLNKAKKNTFKNQVLMYVDELEREVTLAAIGTDSYITLPSDGKSTVISIKDIASGMDSKTDYEGYIRITENDGIYTYELIYATDGEYKLKGKVKPNDLNVDSIVKSDEKSEDVEQYTEYTIGSIVTLKDNSVWYVVSSSDKYNPVVTLMSELFMKNDASGWTSNFDETKMVYDEEGARTPENGNTYCTTLKLGCSVYAASNEVIVNGEVSGMVVEDSTIKKFLDNSVRPYIDNSLINAGAENISDIRLITGSEIKALRNESELDKDKIFINEENFRYWTMTPSQTYSNRINAVNYYDSGYLFYNTFPSRENAVRPVITTLKSNIME